MPARCRIAIMLAAALFVGDAALAQVDDATPREIAPTLRPPAPGNFLPRLPGEPAVEAPDLDAFPVPSVPGDKPLNSSADAPAAPPGAATPSGKDSATKPDTDSIQPNRLAIRAQYDAGMQTVDSGIAELVPFVGRTVIGLKRLALGRISDDRAIAARQYRQVVSGLRGLAIAEQRLRGIDGILDRWRMAQPTSPPEQAAMLAGVYRRAGDASVIRHQIACGRYYGAAADRAIRSGAGRSTVRIPPGC